FSRDDTLLAIASDLGWLWELQQPYPQQIAPPHQEDEGQESSVAYAVRAIAFSPDGASLALGCYDGLVRFHPVRGQDSTLQLLRRGEPSVQSQILSVAFSLTSAHIAAGYRDGVIAIWDRAHPEVPPVLCQQSGEVRSVAFSSDGARLAAGTTNR